MATKSAINLSSLPAFDVESQDLNVLIETPKGNRNKFKYDEKRGLFKLSGVLPMGAVFPFDFGFILRGRSADVRGEGRADRRESLIAIKIRHAPV
ncbi:MAG: inorganic diphosphatase [Blastocatellia bacterium]